MKCESITPHNLTYKSSVRKKAIKSTTAAIIGGGILMSQMPDNPPNFAERFFNYIKSVFYKLINNAKISKKKKEYGENLLDYEKDFINKKLNTSNTDVFDELVKDRYMLDSLISSQINEPETDIMPEVETIFRDPDIPKEERKYIFQLKNDNNTDLKSALIDYKFAVQKRDKIFDFISKYNPQSNREEDVVSEIKDFYTSYKYFENFRNEIHDVKNTEILVKDFPDSDYILTMLNSETQENFDLKFKIFKFMEKRNLLGDFSAKSSMGDSEYAFNHLNKLNFELAKKLIITDKYIPYEIDKILEITDEKNINALEKVCLDKNIINKRIVLSHNSIHYNKKFIQNIRQIDAANADTISAYYELKNKGITSVETLINLKPETIELSKKYHIPICLVKTNTINEDNAHFIQRLVKAKVKDTLIETFAEESQKRQGRILLETLFDDKRFNLNMISEIYNDVFFDYNRVPKNERKSLPLETFNDLMDIVNCKELKPEEIHSVIKNIHSAPKTFRLYAQLSRDKNCLNAKHIPLK